MRKHNKLLIIIFILLILLVVSPFIIVRIFNKINRANSLSTGPKTSEFATGGEMDESTRTYDDRFGSSGGYTPVKLDVSSCPAGRDAVYFGLGHTEFLVEGPKNSTCVFRYGIEIEDPDWDGKLNITCRVPTGTTVSLTVADGGINFSSIRQYCSGNE